MSDRVSAGHTIFDPQCVLYDRLVRRGGQVDAFSAKRLYPGLSVSEAVARIERLRRRV